MRQLTHEIACGMQGSQRDKGGYMEGISANLQKAYGDAQTASISLPAVWANTFKIKLGFGRKYLLLSV